jgi:hypothetical protein
MRAWPASTKQQLLYTAAVLVSSRASCGVGMLLQATGWLHKADVKTALAGFFKGKSVSTSMNTLHACTP